MHTQDSGHASCVPLRLIKPTRWFTSSASKLRKYYGRLDCRTLSLRSWDLLLSVNSRSINQFFNVKTSAKRRLFGCSFVTSLNHGGFSLYSNVPTKKSGNRWYWTEATRNSFTQCPTNRKTEIYPSWTASCTGNLDAFPKVWQEVDHSFETFRPTKKYQSHTPKQSTDLYLGWAEETTASLRSIRLSKTFEPRKTSFPDAMFSAEMTLFVTKFKRGSSYATSWSQLPPFLEKIATYSKCNPMEFLTGKVTKRIFWTQIMVYVNEGWNIRFANGYPWKGTWDQTRNQKRTNGITGINDGSLIIIKRPPVYLGQTFGRLLTAKMLCKKHFQGKPYINSIHWMLFCSVGALWALRRRMSDIPCDSAKICNLRRRIS